MVEVVDRLPSAKDATNARYAGPARVFLRGPTAPEQVRFARTLLGDLRSRLALGGITHGARTITTPDGTRITVLYDGVTNIIRIDAPPVTSPLDGGKLILFLETGWVHIGDIYPIDAEEKPPGALFYSETVLVRYRSYRSQTLLPPPALPNAPWLDKFIFFINTQQGLFEVRPYQAGMDSLGIPANAQQKRLAWLSGALQHGGCCVQTGKLKLFLQSQMGRRTDDGLNFVNDYGVTPPRKSNTIGIYTSDDQDYYILSMTDTTVSAQKIKFPESLQWFARLIKNSALSDRNKSKLEAYLFSTAIQIDDTVSVPITATIESTEPIEFLVEGEPFYYGWKANWKGDRWSIVTNEPKWDELQVYILYHIARRYTITLTERVVDGVLTKLVASFTKEEEVNWTPRVGIDSIWYPDPLFNAMLPFVPIPDAFHPYPGGILAADAPVYCFYDADDDLVVIRHFIDALIPAHTPNFPTGFPGGATGGCGSSFSQFSDIEHLGATKGGFYSELYTTVDTSYQNSVHEYDSTSIFESVEKSVICQPRLPMDMRCIPDEAADTYARNRLYYWMGYDGCVSDMSLRHVERGSVSMYNYNFSGQSTAKSALIIPFLDCEAAYLGRYKYRAGPYSVQSQVGSVFLSIQSVHEPYIFQHSAFWAKSDIWGEGTEMSTVIRTGLETSVTIEFTLLTKNNKIDNINHAAIDGRVTTGGTAPITGDRSNVTYYPSESALNIAIDEAIGYAGLLFSPVLFGLEDKHYYNYICAVEGVAGDMYYSNDMRSYSEGRLPDSLPEGQNYNGLFLGWN